MAHLNFTWDYETPDGITFNLYENGEKAVSDIGQMSFSLLMDGKDQGTYSYHVTAFEVSTGLESVPSNVVSADFFTPAAPANLKVSWTA